MELSLPRYLRRQIHEIESDPTLRVYGALLAFLQALSAMFWWHSDAASFLARGTEAICWPMWPRCESWRVLDLAGTRAAIVVFLLLSVGVMALFARRAWTSRAYVALAALNVLKLAILALDFRLRMNHHIMAFWVTAVFLLVPRKKIALRVMILLFYFWAGLLKLNSEWLSGSALYVKPWLFDGALLPWACGYVVILEIALIWGLLLDGSWVAWAVWAQLCLFHLFSFRIVGFFYPCLMYAIIAIYPLSWIGRAGESTLVSLRRGRVGRGVYAAAILFSLTQLWSKLLPGDTAITGEGRALALHMFDAQTFCEAKARVRLKTGNESELDLRLPMATRLRCDPIVFLSRARRLCAGSPALAGLDLSLRTRRSNARELSTVIDIKDFCEKDVRYSMFLPNDWIRK